MKLAPALAAVVITIGCATPPSSSSAASSSAASSSAPSSSAPSAVALRAPSPRGQTPSARTLSARAPGGPGVVVAGSAGVCDGCEWPAWTLALGRGVATDEPRALAMFEGQCKGGDVDACAAAGRVLSWPRRMTADVGAGVALLRDSCARGAWMGCAWLASLAQSGYPVDHAWLEAGNRDAATSAQLERECAAGFAIACNAWAASDASQAVKARARACDLDDADACAALATADADAKACERGRVAACRALGTKDAMQRACFFGDERACADAVAHGGRALEAAPWARSQLDLALHACAQDDVTSCAEAGLALLDGEGIESNADAASALLQLSCDRGDPMGCAGLALVLDANPALPTSTGVVAASSSACQLGVPQACCVWERHAQTSQTRAQARALGRECTTSTARFFSLRDLRVHRFAASSPTGEFVRGSMIEGEFVPAGDVEGAAAIPAAAATADRGHPGYLELAHATFMGQEEARTPRPPYVEGRMTEAGFVATSRKVKR